MIKIATSEVKEFLKRARPIKTYGVLPILEYIKLDCDGDSATCTKTNNNTWVVHEVKAEFKDNISILIDEKLLTALINNSSADSITITVDRKKVTLSDGRSDLSFAFEKVENYPALPAQTTDAEGVSLPVEVLYSIKAATSIITLANEFRFSYCYVNGENNKTDVFSTNNAVVFFKKTFDLQLPPITISPEAGNIISGFEQVTYYTANNYDFFDCGKTTYGFIRPVFTAPPYQKPFSACRNTQYFEIDREQLLQFCELTASSSPSTTPIITMEGIAGQAITFRHDDHDYKIHIKMDFMVEKNFTPPLFNIVTNQLVPLLKAIDTKTVRWSPVNDTVYCIWSIEDPLLLTLLSGVTPAAKK